MTIQDCLLAFPLAALAAASWSTATENSELQPSRAIVYGVAVNEQQEPVAVAEVTIQAFADSCDSDLEFSHDKAITDSFGFYRKVLGGLHVESIETCVVVQVKPGDTVSYRETSSSGAMVTFVHEASMLPVDSVRVDIVLRRR